jgi:selenocysteine lyase/cysteine desulfurase
MMNKLKDIRKEFKVFETKDFLDWAVVGVAPERAVKAINKLLESAMYFPEENASLQHVAWDKEAQPLKLELAKLLNASEDEIALTGSSTTQGIQIAFESIQPKKGENIVTCDLEFPLAGAELQKWREKGVEIRVVRNKNGLFDLNDFQKLIDKNTKVVFLSSVTWVNGYRFDLASISELVHKFDGYLVLDSVQHLGAMNLDVKETKVDFIASGGHKWLTTPFGMGFLYINKEIIDIMKPPFYGYLNMEEPKGGWDAYFRDPNKNPITNYKFQTNAKKFEYGGTSAYPSIIGLRESVSIINEIGIKNIQAHILKLKNLLIEELQKIGANIIPPLKEEENYSSITMFRMNKKIDDDYKLIDRLSAEGVKVSGRGSSGIGGIRVSIHYPNTEEDVLKLVETVKKLR